MIKKILSSIKVYVLVAFLLLVIMTFSGLINYMTFTDNYNRVLTSTYSVAGQELVRNIEYALFYGKPIDNYYGMNDTLIKLHNIIPELKEVFVVSLEGEILYDINGFVNDKFLPEELHKTSSFTENTITEQLSYRIYKEHGYIFIGIKKDSKHIATLMMIFPEKLFMSWNSSLTLKLINILIAIIILSMIILTIIFHKSKLLYDNLNISKKKLMTILLVIIGTAQISYSIVNYTLFKDAYLNMAHTSKRFVQNIIQTNIENINAKSLSLDNIEGFENYLESIQNSLPQIQRIIKENDTVIVHISNDYIRKQMNRILFDMITVLIVALIFMVEMIYLIILLLKKNSTKIKTANKTIIERENGHNLMRTLSFFVYFSAFIPLTFIPIVMRQIYSPILGISKDVVLGLPLSSEMLGGVLAIIISGMLIHRIGWQKVFYTGGFFLIMGNIMSAYSFNPSLFIISRAISGLGLGFFLMTMRSLVASMPQTSLGIAAFSAGAIAGLNCGAVVGGMLADQIGYSIVFVLSALIAFVPLFFVCNSMSEFKIKTLYETRENSIKKLAIFLSDKKSLFFLIGIFIPFFITSAFLDYLFPLFASAQGLYQSDISRGFLLNGLIIIYFGPILTKFLTKKTSNTSGVIYSMAIVLVALLLFVFFGTITSAFVTLAMLGIAESFGVSLKTTYFLNSKGVKDMEINQRIAYFSILVNISRIAGPIIFGLAMTLGIRTGVGIMVLLFFVLLVLFSFYNTSTSRKSSIS
ncbi:UNVERIFIED_CONTAM: putative MFS family arabinose efflux permease [Acetivibrio alkalicellulosi]